MEPRAWAAAFCETLKEWQLGKAQDGVELLPAFQRSRDLQAARASVVELFDRVTTRTDSMIQKLKAMEPPAVETGPAGQRALIGGFAQLRPVFVHARERARLLPISSRPAMERGFRRLDKAYQRELDATSNAFDKLDSLDSSRPESSEAAHAFENQPACRATRGLPPPKS